MQQNPSADVLMSPASTAYSNYLTNKANEIKLVLAEPDLDLWRLRELALSDGGLVNGEYRGEVLVCFNGSTF